MSSVFVDFIIVRANLSGVDYCYLPSDSVNLASPSSSPRAHCFPCPCVLDRWVVIFFLVELMTKCQLLQFVSF